VPELSTPSSLRALDGESPATRVLDAGLVRLLADYEPTVFIRRAASVRRAACGAEDGVSPARQSRSTVTKLLN